MFALRDAVLRVRHYEFRSFGADLTASLAVAFLGIPQTLAYAIIAGLPPVVGLYAAILPAITGALLRSTAHVVVGPTNALSLLIGASLAQQQHLDPTIAAITIAAMVGVFQLVAGVLRWGSLADFVSSSVVIGYMTGGGLLIAAGQLHAATGTSGPKGALWTLIVGWLSQVHRTDLLAVSLAAASMFVVLGARTLSKKLPWNVPGPVIATVTGIAANIYWDLHSMGVRQVGDLAEITGSFPPLTSPDISEMPGLFSIAAAATVLSMVESSSVARAIATKTGERVDHSADLVAQGVANLCAAMTSGYPVSGSLARSVLNERAGARTFLSSALSGVWTLVALLSLGPWLNRIPMPVLAGVIMVIALDLFDLRRIRLILSAGRMDAAAFLATAIGSWVLPLDQAIYIGVALSLVMLMRQLRGSGVSELWFDQTGKVHETRGWRHDVEDQRAVVRILHFPTPLFFAAAPVLEEAVEDAQTDPRLRILILRPPRAATLDYTSVQSLVSVAKKMQESGRMLMLVGCTPATKELLLDMGSQVFSADQLFGFEEQWLSALERAYRRALQLSRPDACTAPETHDTVAHGTPGDTKLDVN